jgi:hypothetical protein
MTQKQLEEERGTVLFKVWYVNEYAGLDPDVKRAFYARSYEEVLDTVGDKVIRSVAAISPCAPFNHLVGQQARGTNSQVVWRSMPFQTELGSTSPRWHAEMETAYNLICSSITYKAPVKDAWKARELTRMDEYEHLADSATQGLPLPADHYLHLPTGNSDPVMIAYTENDEKGRRDKQKVMKFGRYLAKHFPELENEEIERRVKLLRASRSTENGTLKFATDKPTINRIFETSSYPADGGCESCMLEKFREWPTRPYHVYAGTPDVAVGYMTVNGQIVARSVINVKRNQYIRIYAMGNTSSTRETRATKFRSALHAAGYSVGNLAGCQLTETRNNAGEVLLPYIDGAAYNVNSDWVVTRKASCWEAHEVDGRPLADEDDESPYCYECDHRYGENDLTLINDRLLCDHCLDSNYTHANTGHSTTGYVQNDAVVTTCDDDTYWGECEEVSYDQYNDVWHHDNCGHTFLECEKCGLESWDEEDIYSTTDRGPHCEDCHYDLDEEETTEKELTTCA